MVCGFVERKLKAEQRVVRRIAHRVFHGDLVQPLCLRKRAGVRLSGLFENGASLRKL